LPAALPAPSVELIDRRMAKGLTMPSRVIGTENSAITPSSEPRNTPSE
jgi:hypothetical protein